MTTLLTSRTHPHSLNFTSYTHKHHLNLSEVSSIALQMDQISFPTSVPASTNNRGEDNQPNTGPLSFVNDLFEFFPGYISVPGVSSPRARIFDPFNMRLNQYGLDLSNFFCRFLVFYVLPATHKVLKAGSYAGRSAPGAALLANDHQC